MQSPGAERYKVYRAIGACPSAGFTLLAQNILTTSYSDTTVSGGTTYNAYRVAAFNDQQSCESAQGTCFDAAASGVCTLAPAFAGAPSSVRSASRPCR